MSDVEDDFWGSGEESESRNEESTEIRKLRSVHSKRGYLDGITSAKEDNLQAGFDESFPLGAQYGIDVGKILGGLQMLVSIYGDEDPELREQMKLVQEELRINKVLAKRHFDEEMNPLDTLAALIGKWQAVLDAYKSKYV